MLISFIIITSCSNEDTIHEPFEHSILNSSEISNFGEMHNDAMNYISDNMREVQSPSEIASEVNKLAVEYLSGLSDGIETYNSLHINDFTLMAYNDVIHQHFSDHHLHIKEGYTLFNQTGLINSLDYRIITDLVDLLESYNSKLLDEVANEFDERQFFRKFDSLYNQFLSEKDSHTSIAIGIMEITHSSYLYWKNQDLRLAPEFALASYEEFIIPAIVLRVVIKDAIGAIEGAITTGIGNRIISGDWDWDTGKMSEREAMIGMLIGAVSSSGGFLGKMAVRALKLM
jgi:hypothetical protein